MHNPFIEFLVEHKDEINEILAAYYRDQTSDPEIERYLYEPLGNYSANAGKRHRPLICMLASVAVGGSWERAASCAAAIEHFQTAALIHDDIADNGKLRRGKPCLHITQGTGIAINCGDYALSLTTAAVASDPALDNDTKVRLIQELSAMTARTIEGQALDLGWVRDGRFDITVDDYLTMATHKTAFYSGAVPLACGAIIGGGDERQIEALRTFGMHTGLAFQIQDDLLNLIGEKEARNKDFRSDITEGKRTLVAVHALNNSPHRAAIARILSSGETDPQMLAHVVDLFDMAGSIEYARGYALDLTRRAKAELAAIDLDGHCRELLLSMADFFVDRLN